MREPKGFVPSDLQLAKAAGKKLAYLVTGLFSGGLSGLAARCILDEFLPKYHKRICAFIEVLRATETTFGSESKEEFDRLVARLESHFLRFYECYVGLNDQRQGGMNVIETKVNDLLRAYLDLLDLAHELMEFMGLEPGDVGQRKVEAEALVAGYLSEISGDRAK